MGIKLKKDILYNRIKDDILSGKLKAGQKLPQGLVYARELGVSYITLRRAFTELAKDGYIALVHGKGTFICETKPDTAKKRFLVLHDPHQDSTWPYHYIIPGIERTAMSMGIDIETCIVQSIADLEYAEVSKILKQRGISGIILITCGFIGNEKILEVLRGQNIPVLLAHGLREDYQITGWAVTTYNVKNAWREALEYLRDMGHQRIMTLAQKNYKDKIRGYEYDEYRELLKSIGADPSKELICLSDFNSDAMQNELKQAFQQPIPPTAVICNSDFWAPSVYRTLKSIGLRIPEDVAVMGFCGAPDSEYMEPPLSTIDLGYFNIGKTAIEIMADADKWFRPASGEHINPPLIYTSYQLKIRKSTDIKIFEPKYESSNWR